MKYYKVQVFLGHVGTGKGIPAWLYIEAKSMLEAVDLARKFRGVKHSKLPIQAQKITYEEYLVGRESKDYNAKMTLIFNCEETNDNEVN